MTRGKGQFEGGELGEGQGADKFKTSVEKGIKDVVEEMGEMREVPIQVRANVQAMLLPVLTKLSLNSFGVPKVLMPPLKLRIEPQENVQSVLLEDKNLAPFGTFILSPEASNVKDIATADYEYAAWSKIASPEELSTWTIQDALDYVYERYGKTHIIAGSELLLQALSDPNRLPAEFLNCGSIWLPGSLLKDGEGNWHMLGFIASDTDQNSRRHIEIITTPVSKKLNSVLLPWFLLIQKSNKR